MPFLRCLFLAVMLVAGFAGAVNAQTSEKGAPTKPAPPTVKPVDPTKNLPPVALGDTLAKFTKTLTDDYLPIFVNEIERPFGKYVQLLGFLLAVYIAGMSLMKMARRGNGDPEDLWMLGARWAAGVLLIFVCQGWVSGLMALGLGLTYADGQTLVGSITVIDEEGGGGSSDAGTGEDYRGGAYLNGKRKQLQKSFNETYQHFVKNGFFVYCENDPAVPIPPVTIVPNPNPGDINPVGYLMPNSSEVKDNNWIASFMKGLNPSSWNPATMFSMLNGSRGFMESGFLFLHIIVMFALPIMKMSAPIFSALWIDEGLGKSISLPFLKGVITFTIVFPFVVVFIEIIGYMVGNIALLGFAGTANGQAVPQTIAYTWDPQTLTIVRQANPNYHIALGVFLFALTGAFAWVSPYFALKFSQGEVFGAVVSSLSAVGGAFVATGISYLSASAGAAFQRTADSLQNTGEKNASDIQAAAARRASIQSARGAYAQTVINAQAKKEVANDKFNGYTRQPSGQDPGGVNAREQHLTGEKNSAERAEQQADSVTRTFAEGAKNLFWDWDGFDQGTTTQQKFGRKADLDAYATRTERSIKDQKDQIERDGVHKTADGEIQGAGANLSAQIGAANTTYGGAVSAAQVKHDFSEMAAGVRAMGSVVTAVGNTASSSLLGAFEQLNRL